MIYNKLKETFLYLNIKVYTMKKFMMRTLQANLPRTPDGLDLSDSIIVEDEYGASVLVGGAAARYSPETGKRRGGQPKQSSWRTFLRAAVAHSLGAGEHKKSVAFSAPKTQMEFFRGKNNEGVTLLTEENTSLIKKTTEKIRFKYKINDPWLECCLDITETPIVNFETVAVVKGLPPRYKTFVLWQLGFGDWQQLALVDAVPDPTSMTLIDGVEGALNIFQEKTGLSKSQAYDSWISGEIPEVGSYNGKKESAESIIFSCLKSYFNNRIGPLLNNIDRYRDRIHHVILSGGSSKSNQVLEALAGEIEAEGLKLIPIAKVMESENLEIKDPLFATILGLSSQAEFSIDVGNSYIKTGVR